jgi:hypothetical protein
LFAGRTEPTASDVDAAIDQAVQSLARFTMGELTEPETRRTKGRAYISFCRMAELWTIGAGRASWQETQKWDQSLRSLIEALVGTAKQRAELRLVAGHWLKTKPRPSAGVLLLGTVEGFDGSGRRRWMRLRTEQGEMVDVMGRIEPLRPLGAELAVLGLLVESPQASLPDYHGGLPTAVWAGLVVESPGYGD